MRAVANIFRANVEVHLRRTLCDVRWNVLLAPIIHRLFLASLSQIVSAGFVTFVSLWWKVHCARGCQYIPDPTSAFTLAPLAARSGGTPCWSRLLLFWF